MATESRGKSRTHQLVLFLGLFGAIAAGMALAVFSTSLFGGEPQTAHAVVGQITSDKSDTGDGTYAPGETVTYVITLNVGSETSQTWEFNDLLPSQLGNVTLLDLTPTAAGVGCSAGTNNVNCTVAQGTGPGLFFITIVTSVDVDAACGAVTNNWQQGSTPGQGTVEATWTIQVVDCSQPEQPVFELCKVWDHQGATADPRDFTFLVSDTSESVQVTIPNVAEGSEECILVSAAEGPIVVTEIVPDGFDMPEWELEGAVGGTVDDIGFEATFLLSDDCHAPILTGTLVERLVAVVQDGEPLCTLTFVNEDNDRLEVTPSPSPTFSPPCTTCGQPQPTSTNTPQPPTATPSNTPIPPPTATPTTGTGNQNPGLTDAQRTQTAVAGERTAAALITPKPPATGSATPDTTGQGTNLLLILVGLSFAAGGLGLVARRRR